MRPPWWVRRALPSPTTGLGSPGGGQGQSRDPRLSSRRWASVAELDRGSPGLAGVEAAPTPTGQGWKGRGEQAGGEGQRDTPRWAHSSSAITVSPAPGRGLILARLDLPLHGKSLPFTARLMCSVGNAESGGGEEPTYYYVLKTHKPPMEGPLPGHKALLPSGPGFWRLWGSGWGPPQRWLQWPLPMTNGGWRAWGTLSYSNKRGPLHSPFPTPSVDTPGPMTSLPVLATGSGLTVMAS